MSWHSDQAILERELVEYNGGFYVLVYAEDDESRFLFAEIYDGDVMQIGRASYNDCLRVYSGRVFNQDFTFHTLAEMQCALKRITSEVFEVVFEIGDVE